MWDDRHLDPRPGNPLNRDSRASRLVVPLLVGLITVLAFLPTLANGFVNWDDEKNFLTNPHYRGLGLEQLGWMWSTFHLGHYVPLSWMTLGFDYAVWGMNPKGYHLTNVLLHAACAVALYFVARRLLRLTGEPQRERGQLMIPAAFAALFFALHPLRVESVAWVTERRDMLSLLFGLLSVLSYLRAVAGEEGAVRRYWASVLLFALALLSKATVMALPAALLVLNVYPLRRLGGREGWFSAAAMRVYLELLPFGLFALGMMILSIVALHPPEQLGPGAKVAVSAYSLAFYIWKTIAPSGLSPLYEMPQQVDPLAGKFIAGYVVAITLTLMALLLRKRWPGITASWFAFVLVSLPMLGVVQNGPQIAADRYTYHSAPIIAILAGAVLWGATRVMARAVLPVTFAAMILAVLALLTWRQIGVWRDSTTLWTRVLDEDDNSAVGHSAWARLLFEQNKVEEGVQASQRAVAIAPAFAEAHNDLGVGMARLGHLDEAVAQYKLALSLKPGYDEPESNWGVVAVHQGDLDAAIAHYRRALELNPDNADAQVNWGNALVRFDRPDEAIAHYQAALVIRPDHADAHHNWGVALARQGKYAEAIEQFRSALAINPGHVEAKAYLERATQLLTPR